MRRSRTTVAVLVAALALTACGGEREDAATGEGGRLSIATGNTTGVYYVMGGGLARLIGDGLPGYSATAEATGASVENIQPGGEAATATSPSPSPTPPPTPPTGKGAFDGPQPIRALARIYTNYTQVLVRTDAGITSIEGMKGKTVSTGSPNSGTEVIAERLLTAAGVDPEAGIKRQKLSLPETVQGMKDGTIEAMFWSGGLPTRRHHRPGHLARRQGPLPRPVRLPAQAAGRVRRGLPAGDHRARRLQAARAGGHASACPTCWWSRTR